MPKEEVQKEYSARKVEFAARLYKLLADNKNVLIINADNVGSQSMHNVRAELRKTPRATILMGKNTMIKYVIRKYATDTGNQAFNKLADLCKLNVGLVFTNDDMKDVRDVLEKNKVLLRHSFGKLLCYEFCLIPRINLRKSPTSAHTKHILSQTSSPMKLCLTSSCFRLLPLPRLALSPRRT